MGAVDVNVGDGHRLSFLSPRSALPLSVHSVRTSTGTRQQGTYLGTLEGVNHLDLVGWINTARYKWAEIMGREIKFKPATFYLGIADHLARVVEGQEQPRGAEEGEQGEADRPAPERETSGERRGRERAEMADSLGKGESQVGTPATPKTSERSSIDGVGDARQDAAEQSEGQDPVSGSRTARPPSAS